MGHFSLQVQVHVRVRTVRLGGRTEQVWLAPTATSPPIKTSPKASWLFSQCLHRLWQQQNPKRWRRWPLQTTNDASAALQTLRRSRRLKINNLLRTRTNRWTRSGAVTRTEFTSAPCGFLSPGFALSLSLARTS